MHKVLFLPGAGASPEFWKPVARLLPAIWHKRLFGWPGLGHEPHDRGVRSIDDLVRLVVNELDQPVDLVAQSMGGAVAARIALDHPACVRRLALVATSAGVDMAGLGASDWRAAYRIEYPHAADWITAHEAAAPLAIEDIAAPTALIWGGRDRISPPSVGRHLAERLPNATLHVLEDGDHDLALTMPGPVAQLIRDHLE